MKLIGWSLASGAKMTLNLGESPVLVFADTNGAYTRLDVTQEDLEGISDVLTDGRFHLKREKEKRQEEMEIKKWENPFKAGLDFGVILKNAAAEIKAKLEGESATAAKCTGDCGMNYCDVNGCQERERILVDPISDKAEENVSVSGDTHRGEGKEASNG